MKLLQLVATEHNGKFNATYKTHIAYTKGEIGRIMWRGVFCLHKPYFLIPGHILCESILALVYYVAS